MRAREGRPAGACAHAARRMRESRCARSARYSLARSPVIRYPEMTKKMSTPTNPPAHQGMPQWQPTTSKTAMPRRPAISERKVSPDCRKASLFSVLPSSGTLPPPASGGRDLAQKPRPQDMRRRPLLSLARRSSRFVAARNRDSASRARKLGRSLAPPAGPDGVCTRCASRDRVCGRRSPGQIRGPRSGRRIGLPR